MSYEVGVILSALIAMKEARLEKSIKICTSTTSIRIPDVVLINEIKLVKAEIDSLKNSLDLNTTKIVEGGYCQSDGS